MYAFNKMHGNNSLSGNEKLIFIATHVRKYKNIDYLLVFDMQNEYVCTHVWNMCCLFTLYYLYQNTHFGGTGEPVVVYIHIFVIPCSFVYFDWSLVYIVCVYTFNRF